MFLVVLHFGRRHFVLCHACSAQTDQLHQVVWSRIGDILVIVIDHRLMCELPRSRCKQECGDVGISTPNTLRCMRCHSTALFVWFDARTSRFCYFRMFFSFSNFLTHRSHLLLDMSLITQHWYLIFERRMHQLCTQSHIVAAVGGHHESSHRVGILSVSSCVRCGVVDVRDLLFFRSQDV